VLIMVEVVYFVVLEVRVGVGLGVVTGQMVV